MVSFEVLIFVISILKLYQKNGLKSLTFPVFLSFFYLSFTRQPLLLGSKTLLESSKFDIIIEMARIARALQTESWNLKWKKLKN